MNILLYTPAPPNENHSGTLMLQQMCEIICEQTEHKIFCFAVNDPALNIHISSRLKQIPYKNVFRPIERMLFPTDWPFASLINHFLEYIKDIYVNLFVVKSAVDFGEKNKVDCVWAVIQGKTTIISAKKIADRLRVPLVTQIWDAPKWVIINSGFDQSIQKRLLAKFDEMILSSKVCAVASWAMEVDCNKDYKNTRTVVLVPSLKKEIALNTAGNFDSKELNVVIAGQIYATEEWNAFIKAFQDKGWIFGGRKLKINLIGNFKHVKYPKSWPIIKHGYMDQESLIKLVSKMDVCYCPYWFDQKFEIIARTSFPSKLSSYFAAGCPVFFHGPDYSSPARFIKENGGGVNCNSLETNKIIECFGKIVSSNKEYKKYAQEASAAFMKYLTNDSFSKEIIRMFKIAEEK
jgi:hypothetical protein